MFSIARAEANRRIIVLEASPREGSTLDVVKPNTNQQNNGVATGERNGKNQTPRPQNNKDRVWCTCYKKPRHTREDCRRLYGK